MPAQVVAAAVTVRPDSGSQAFDLGNQGDPVQGLEVSIQVLAHAPILPSCWMRFTLSSQIISAQSRPRSSMTDVTGTPRRCAWFVRHPISARVLMCCRQLLPAWIGGQWPFSCPVRVRNTGSVTDTSSGIRAAVPGDIGEILKVDHLAAQADLERAEYLRGRVRSGECLVHLAGGSVRGFVVLQPARFFGRDFIDLLVVDAAHRRAGIGRALLEAALSTAGTDQVFTSTNVSNMAMRSLLEDEGWSFSGQLTGLDEGDPELVFYAIRQP